MIKKVLILILTMTMAIGAFGQSLEETLSSMAGNNASMYTQPLGDGMGAMMNSGYYHRSRVHKLLGFDISAKVMGIQVGDDEKFFNFSFENAVIEYDLNDIITTYTLEPISISLEDVYKGSNTRVPTISGSIDSIGVIKVNEDHLISVIENQLIGQLTEELGAAGAAVAVGQMSGVITTFVNQLIDLQIPGLGLSYMALPMLQASIGLPIGIELTVRALPEYDIEELGLLSMYGGGVRMSLDQFIPIPLFPLDITAGAFYSQMTIGDVFESKNTSVSLQVGKSINLLIVGVGVYADAGYETSSVSIAYVPDPKMGIGTDPIEFDLETDPGLRYGLGLHIKPVPFTHINLHVAQTPNNLVATMGLAISIR